MSGIEIQLPTSIYDPPTTRKILAAGIAVAVIDAGRYLRIRVLDPGVDAAAQLSEQLNQALRASIEAKLPAARAEDE